MNEELTKEEKEEGLYKAISKGLSCNGITDWQYVVLSSGKEMAIRFSGIMV